MLHVEDMKINQGRILSRVNADLVSDNIQDYEFKVFSQWGEDGILQYLTRVIDIPNKTFIEFGVENFQEANCRFLMMKDNWSGFIVDGSDEFIENIRSSNYYWKYDLTAVRCFITRENIDDLLSLSGFDRDLGILSIDIDGNDYYVLEAIKNFNPRILVCEYNAVFGADRPISVVYKPDFFRGNAHHSNLFFGASLSALKYLAAKKNYTLVGTCSAGVNAFFVRNDLMNGSLRALTVQEAFTASKFRESRDEVGRLTYLSGEERLELIRGMPVRNVITNEIEGL